MIHYLKIENFGPIYKEVVIDFEVSNETDDDAYQIDAPDGRKLLKLAYIYGANASGKTTVLKAFEFLRKLLLTPLNNKAAKLDFEPFLFRERPHSYPSRLELSFYAYGLRYIYEIKFNKEFILEEKIVYYQSVKPTEIFTRTTDPEKRLSTIEFGSKIRVPSREKDLIESNTLHNNTVIGAFAKTNVDIPELERLNLWFNTFLLGMLSPSHSVVDATASLMEENPLLRTWMNSYMHKADEQIKDVKLDNHGARLVVPLDEFSPPNFSDRFVKLVADFKEAGKIQKLGSVASKSDSSTLISGVSQPLIDFNHSVANQKTYSLPIFAESNGTKRFFGLGGPFYELIHGSHFLCIDELETSLHPDLMTYLLQIYLLNAKSSQLLITTHSLVLMENQDFLRRDALWFSEKQRDGSVDLYSAADFDTSTVRKESSIINAYRAGKLGAKPNFGSPYILEE
jgi:AAA15 family ATPase/GTPase